MSKIQTQQKQIKTIESLMISSYDEAQASRRWISKQSVNLQLKVNKDSVKKYLIFRDKFQDIDKELLSIAANLSISSKIHEVFRKRNRKNPNFTSEDLLLNEEFEFNSFSTKGVAKKEEYLRRKLSKILSWRKSGYSYRKISEIFLDKYSISISREKIRTFIKKQKEI